MTGLESLLIERGGHLRVALVRTAHYLDECYRSPVVVIVESLLTVGLDAARYRLRKIIE